MAKKARLNRWPPWVAPEVRRRHEEAVRKIREYERIHGSIMERIMPKGIVRVSNANGRKFFACSECGGGERGSKPSHQQRMLTHKKGCPNRVEKAVK